MRGRADENVSRVVKKQLKMFHLIVASLGFKRKDHPNDRISEKSKTERLMNKPMIDKID